MRAFLLKSVAVATLVVAPSLAFAEGPAEHGPGGGGEHGAGGGAPAHGEGGGAHPPGGAAPMHAPMERAPAGGGEKKMGAPAKAEAPRAEPGKTQAKRPMGGPAGEKAGAKPQTDHMKPAGGAAKHGEAKSAHVSGEQRTRMQSTFRAQHAERIPHADFRVGVGGFVPRHYHYYPLPPAIYEIVPEYQGYDYVEVGDQILIIDPDNGEIVYVIDE